MVYKPWSTIEVTKYNEVRCRDKRLRNLYELAGIPISSPEKRAKFIAEKLELTATDQETIIGIAQKKGRPEALRQLEEIFVANFS